MVTSLCTSLFLEVGWFKLTEREMHSFITTMINYIAIKQVCISSLLHFLNNHKHECGARMTKCQRPTLSTMA